MQKLLAAGALLWPLLLASAVWRHDAHPGWSAAISAIASRVCHQRPDRSFFTAGVQWPVCGRCAGLYLAAPFGAVLGLGRRAAGLSTARARGIAAAAAIPTMATLAAEWLHLAPVTTLERAVAAVPLGMAIAYLLVHAAKPETNRVH